MKFYAVLSWVFLFMISPSFAQDVPKQTIVGLEKPIPLGEIVTLSPSPLEKVPNLENVTYTWIVFDVTQDKTITEKVNGVRPDGDGILFGSGIKNKKLTVVLVATYTFAIPDDKNAIVKRVIKSSKIVKEVKLGEEEVKPDNPDVPPVPPMPVNPVTPDATEKFGMAQFSYDKAQLVTDKALRVSGAKALGISFKSIDSKIAAGALKTPEAVLKDVAESNADALNKVGAKAAWVPWGEAYAERVFSLYESGNLKTIEDFRQLFKEVSRGLAFVQ